MKNKPFAYFNTLLVLLFISAYPAQLLAQTMFMHTDRNCYVSGDLVFLKIYHPDFLLNPLSEQTVCVDLLTAENRFVHGEFLKLQQGLASGYFNIPDTLSTGTYQLRVYNQPNPNELNVCKTSKFLYISNRFGKNDPIFESTPISNIDSTISTIQESINCNLHLSIDTLAPRKKLQVTLSVPDQTGDAVFASVSVFPVSDKEAEMELRNNSLSPISQTKDEGQEIGIPGIKVQGTLVSKTTETPVTNAVVFLSFQDTLLRLKYDLVDSLGQFIFYMNQYFGKQTGYFSAYQYPSLEPIYDAKFQLSEPYLKTGQKTADAVLRYEASFDTLNILKSVIAKAYLTSFVNETDIPLREPFSYEQNYLSGKMTDVVFLDHYVSLPDFEQIAIEILPFLKYKKEKTGWRISVIDGINDIVRNNPLVFVDGIPLMEHSLLFDWGTSHIKKIEIKSQPRFFGDLYFEKGLVFIWTKEQNFWSQNISAFIQETELSCYQKPIQFSFPDYSNRADYQFPDFRQTLYWEPHLIFNSNNPANFYFYTSDEKGKIKIEICGITSHGQPIICHKIFTVE